MFDIGWSEIVVIAVVALIVIGPKELPMVLKTVGAWVAKARSLARDFQSSVDEMIRESELDKMKKEFEETASLDVAKEIEKTVDPTGELAKSIETPDLGSIGDISGPPQPPVTPETPKPAEIAAAPEPAPPAPPPGEAPKAATG